MRKDLNVGAAIVGILVLGCTIGPSEERRWGPLPRAEVRSVVVARARLETNRNRADASGHWNYVHAFVLEVLRGTVPENPLSVRLDGYVPGYRGPELDIEPWEGKTAIVFVSMNGGYVFTENCILEDTASAMTAVKGLIAYHDRLWTEPLQPSPGATERKRVAQLVSAAKSWSNGDWRENLAWFNANRTQALINAVIERLGDRSEVRCGSIELETEWGQKVYYPRLVADVAAAMLGVLCNHERFYCGEDGQVSSGCLTEEDRAWRVYSRYAAVQESRH